MVFCKVQDATIEQLQTVLKTRKPTCSGIITDFTCGHHQNFTAHYDGPTVALQAGDEVALNGMLLTIVSIDAKGDGEGMIRVPTYVWQQSDECVAPWDKGHRGRLCDSRKGGSTGIKVSLLNDKLRDKLEKAYQMFELATDIGLAFSEEIAGGINYVKDAIENLKNKKENARKLLEATDIGENLDPVINSCVEISQIATSLQDSLHNVYCNKNIKGLDRDKLKDALDANRVFMNKLGPALAECQNTQFTPWTEQPCKGPCDNFVVYTLSAECVEKLKAALGVKDKHYRVDVTIKSTQWLDGEGKTFYKNQIDCNIKETTSWTNFNVKFTSPYANYSGQIYPFKEKSNLPNQTSYKASENKLPMAGKWGDNLFSLVSGNVDDYIFLGRVMHFCPEIEQVAEMPWKRSFNGAKATAKTADFAENLKTISDVVFTVVDGWYIVRGLGKLVLKPIINPFNLSSAKGLIGKEFEEFLAKELPNGEAGFMRGGRDFDAAYNNGKIWIEAKSGKYWEQQVSSSSGLSKFKSDMGSRLKIANENGASYELFSNSPIPQSIKQWLESKGTKYYEILN